MDLGVWGVVFAGKEAPPGYVVADSVVSALGQIETDRVGQVVAVQRIGGLLGASVPMGADGQVTQPGNGDAFGDTPDDAAKAKLLAEIDRCIRYYGSQGVDMSGILLKHGFDGKKRSAKNATGPELEAVLAEMKAAGQAAGNRIQHPPQETAAAPQGRKPAGRKPNPPAAAPPPPPAEDPPAGNAFFPDGDPGEAEPDEAALKDKAITEIIGKIKQINAKGNKALNDQAAKVCAANSCGAQQDPKAASLESLNRIMDELDSLLAEHEANGGAAPATSASSLIEGATQAANERARTKKK